MALLNVKNIHFFWIEHAALFPEATMLKITRSQCPFAEKDGRETINIMV